jgi:hypothetical protein
LSGPGSKSTSVLLMFSGGLPMARSMTPEVTEVKSKSSRFDVLIAEDRLITLFLNSSLDRRPKCCCAARLIS